MKKIFALFALALVVFSLVFSLTGCRGAEDINGVRQTESILKTNYYETTMYADDKALAKLDAEHYLTPYVPSLKSYITAKKGENWIEICYFKSESAAKEMLAQYETRQASSDEKILVGISEKTVFIGTKEALNNATKKLWGNQLKQTFIEDKNYMYIIEGLGNTLIITLGALLIGVVLGVSIAILKYYAEGNPSLKIINFICDLYTTVIRGIPITVLLLIFFFIILVSADGIVVAIIAFGINSGAYMAELVRSGINAVDGGQMEAARSLGMSKWQAMKHIILPQAVKNILPAIGNECIALLKETSVAGYVAVVDLTRGVNLVRNNTYDAFNPLMLSALIYLTLVVGMTQLLKILERRLQKSERRINK